MLVIFFKSSVPFLTIENLNSSKNIFIVAEKISKIIYKIHESNRSLKFIYFIIFSTK